MGTQTSRRTANLYWMVITLALIVVLQGTLLSRVRFFGAHPNLLLTVVVCWSVLRSVSDGLVWGFSGGIGIDLVAGMPLGASALALMPTSFLAGLGRSSVFANNLALPILLVALATPLHGWILLFTQQVRGLPVDWASATLRVIAPELALNALLTALVYPVLRLIVGHLSAPNMEW